MAKGLSRKPNNIVEKNIALLEKLMEYLLAEPHILSALPDKFELVILPQDDPEMRLYNLQLLDRVGSEGKPIVFARIASSRNLDLERARPQLYVPIAA